jgi:hypothetical protein
MDRKINSITVLVVLTTVVAITLAAHIESEYMYFGNASTIIFWLTSGVGTVVAIITGFKAIDVLTERFRILR